MKRFLVAVRGRLKRVPCALVARANRRRAENYDFRSTLVISGVPRGGTTWLAELLGEVDDCQLLWEPLNRNTLRRLADLDFGWRPHIPADAEWPEAERFFRRLLSGQVLHPTVLRARDVPLRPRRYHLVKFCRANRLLPWLVGRVPVRPPVLFVRHPCAVVASQLRWGSWDAAHKPYRPVTGRYSDLIVRHRDVLERLRTPEERMAATWSLDHLVPLSSPANDRAWITVAYERLVSEGEAELARIFARLDLELPPTAVERLRRPSARTQAGAAILEGRDPLSGWRRRLTRDQVTRVLDTVAALGLGGIYTDALEPDYDRLTASPGV